MGLCRWMSKCSKPRRLLIRMKPTSRYLLQAATSLAVGPQRTTGTASWQIIHGQEVALEANSAS